MRAFLMSFADAHSIFICVSNIGTLSHRVLCLNRKTLNSYMSMVNRNSVRKRSGWSISETMPCGSSHVL